VITFDDQEEAIEIANNTQYGLAAGVWTQSIGTAFTMAERLEPVRSGSTPIGR
jgi:aldehyde dehydrogenase (NAD+)